jgi:hypothetical protein
MEMRILIVSIASLAFGTGVVTGFVPTVGRVNKHIGIKSGTSCKNLRVDTNEGATRNIQAFDEWAANCGVQRAEGFTLTSDDGEDWYAATSADLPAGTPILAVPGNMIISTSSSKAELEAMCPSVRAAADKLVKMGGGQYLPKLYPFLKVLVEYERGVESPYYPWLDAVPRLYYNAVSMTDFCIESLPPFVFRLSRDERVKFDNLYRALQDVDILSDDTKEDKELCKWAFSTVQTRRLPGDDSDVKIVPMADMFNHGTDTEVEISIDDDGNCLAYTSYDVPAGYPLRMSYGTPTNPSHFFATYGFLDETCPGTFCKILDIKSTPELVDLGLDFSRMLFYKDTGDVSEEVWDILLYAKILPKYDIGLQRQFYEAHVNGDYETKQAIHGRFTLETVTELKNHVDVTIAQLNDLSRKADGKDFGEHPRLPLILRHNAFVKNTFQMVGAKLESMIEQFAQQGALMLTKLNK